MQTTPNIPSPDDYCGPDGLTAANDLAAQPHAEAAIHTHIVHEPTLLDSLPGVAFFSNSGNYVPRTHCMQTADGSPDWLWIILLITATVGVVGFYCRIFLFWRKAYRAEAPEDRNPRMMQLANIFFWCAICGYVMSVCMFFWPAYRLLTVFLVALNIWSWRFVVGIKDFGIALRANRLQRELAESLEQRNAELESLVEARTAELEVARARADDANEAKSDFLANMSHEIRTPLTAILGYADLLDDDALPPADHAAYVSTVRRNGDHLLQLINDILDLSKIEAGRMTIERIECSPAQVLAEVESLLRPRATSKGISLDVRLLSPLPRTILSDPLRLRQVLVNLVGNAVKFTETGGVRIDAGWDDDASKLTIAVVDSGIGMSPEHTAKVFTPFTQADASMSRRFGGTGLGLMISKRLTEQLGGWLDVESVRGEGSTFTLTLLTAAVGDERDRSISERPRPGVGAHSAAGQPLADARVLLVEDGPDNQRLIAHHLRKAGARVEIAENGRLAIDAVLAARDTTDAFGLVLMDMQMPVMDGYAATRTLRDQHHLATPILALTAHAMADERQRCLDAGCDDLLTKPIDVPTIRRVCSEWLGRSSPNADRAPGPRVQRPAA